MRVLCSWCGQVLEPDDAVDARESHGVCLSCANAWLGDAHHVVRDSDRLPAQDAAR